MQPQYNKEVIIFFIAANIIVAGAAIFFFLILRIQYKRKQLYQKQLLEKEFKTREESFLQISRDLHDDIGSSLSGINILSQLAQQQLTEPNNGTANELMQKINLYTGEVIEKVSDMAWLLKPNKESLSILLSKLKAYSVATASSKNIEVVFHISPKTSGKELSIQERKSIYLISKEALNNAIKYSSCKKIDYHIYVTDQHLTLSIKDDGKGFSGNEPTNGNGLVNMKARANEIGAKLQIYSVQDKGTEIILEL